MNFLDYIIEDSTDMISKGVIILFLAFTVCEFCGKDFKEVSRHKWRCKSRSHQSSSNNHVANDNASSSNIVNPEIINNRSVANVEHIHSLQALSIFIAPLEKNVKDFVG